MHTSTIVYRWSCYVCVCAHYVCVAAVPLTRDHEFVKEQGGVYGTFWQESKSTESVMLLEI